MFCFNKGNRSERYRLYFLLTICPPCPGGNGRDGPGLSPRGGAPELQPPGPSTETSPDSKKETPCPAPYHAKVFWRTQKFLTALFEAKLSTVALG